MSFNRFIATRLTNGSNYNATGDYSASPTNFTVTNSTGRNVIIQGINIQLTCTSAPAYDEYGNASALTNGLNFYYSNPQGTFKVNQLISPKNNVDLLGLTGKEPASVNWVGTVQTDQYHLELVVLQQKIILEPTYQFWVELEDDFTALTGHVFYIQGQKA